MAARYEVSVPASSANLGPGFDTLAIALDMRLKVAGVLNEEWQFDLSGEGAHLLDNCNENLIAKSYAQLCRHHGWPESAMNCSSVSEIPLSRGLGGSAAAIVAGMTLAQLSHSGAVDKEALFQAAAELEGHPDNVAAAVFGSLQRISYNDRSYSAESLPLHSGIRLLLVVPRQMKSTHDMREILPAAIADEDLKLTAQALGQLIMGLADGDRAKLKFSESDLRHQPYRLDALPQSSAIFNLLSARDDVAGAYLSGAGTTVAGLVAGGPDPSAAVQSALAEMGIEAQVLFVQPDDQGVLGDLIE